MAGSRKDVTYVDDANNSFAIQVDESNIELVMAGSVPISTSPNRKPSNLKQLRSVVLSDVTGLIKRTIPVLTQARYAALNNTTAFTLPANDPDEGATVGVSEKKPEKFVRLPKSFDTGKIDGDAT
jgi:hypothetical protein